MTIKHSEYMYILSFIVTARLLIAPFFVIPFVTNTYYFCRVFLSWTHETVMEWVPKRKSKPYAHRLWPVWQFPPCINTLRLRQNGRHFADDTFKRILMNENIRSSINISLKFVPNCLIYNIPALVQILAWRRPGDKPLSEPMVVNLLTHICVTRPQRVNWLCHG